LAEIRIWVNDNFIKTIAGFKLTKIDKRTIAIEKELLRLGDNVITVHAYNKKGARAEAYKHVDYQDKNRKRNLYIIAVGINNYDGKIKIVPKPKRSLDLKYAVEDAESFVAVWETQKGKLFEDVKVVSKDLPKGNATSKEILGQLESLKKMQDDKAISPEDFVMVFLAGHGIQDHDKQDLLKQDSYVFICPGFDIEKSAETGLSSKALNDALAKLNCRKVLFLDTCHAGAMDPLRDLRPNGMGPLILSSCAPHETAGEDAKIEHGFFTYLLLEALGAFDDGLPADENKDGEVNVEELVNYLERYVPTKTAQAKHSPQHPQHSPRDPGVERLFVKEKGS
jgi:uncharacterized caspase-like protein